LIPNPIHKVLSTLATNQVQYLLMGGQACVFYGAAEFSRDCDIAILCEAGNLSKLQGALDQLQATVIAIPPFEVHYLDRGHAVHFRCQEPEARGIRVDVMARMRGVAPFEKLWERRTSIEDATGTVIDLLSLVDLISAKKTQRDKDWPMIRRLVEAHYAVHREHPSEAQVQFWMRESRTLAMLRELVAQHPQSATECMAERPLLKFAVAGADEALVQALAKEQQLQAADDRAYWEPLKRELEQLRLGLRDPRR
jgi:hypothetical protein